MEPDRVVAHDVLGPVLLDDLTLRLVAVLARLVRRVLLCA